MQDNLSLERHHLELQTQGWDPETRYRWTSGKSTHRFPVYMGKEINIFRLEDDLTPKVLDTLTCVGIHLGFSDGLETIWETDGGEEIIVGHTPVEVGESLFIWHTFFSEVQYLPYNGKYTARVPMAYRCPHNITRFKVPGVLYLLERGLYERTFSGV